MKKLIQTIIAVITIATFLPSCKNLVPYSDSLKQKYGWTKDDVKQIQFYVSSEIVLHREILPTDTGEIIGGKIILLKGKKIQEITIKAGKKGVMVDMPNDKKILVSFEISDNYYLSFGVDPNRANQFYLLAEDWKNEMGKVHYNSKVFYTGKESKDAILLVDIRKFRDIDYSHRNAKGRSVGK